MPNLTAANIHFQGKLFSLYEHDFNHARRRELDEESLDLEAAGKNHQAAQANAKASYISATLAFLDAYELETARKPTPMTLDQFRDSGRTVTLAEAHTILGDTPFEVIPHNATAVRIYRGNYWIAQMGLRQTKDDLFNWYLILDIEEYDTFKDGHTLSSLEEILFDWIGEHEAEDPDFADLPVHPVPAEVATMLDAMAAPAPRVATVEFLNEIFSVGEGDFYWSRVTELAEYCARTHTNSDYRFYHEAHAKMNYIAATLVFTEEYDRKVKAAPADPYDFAHHVAARAFMDTRPDLAPMSLDEWLAEHHGELTPVERAAGFAILALCHERGC